MKIAKITAIVAMTAALGASTSALAAWDDETGLTSLGIDISRAGSTPEAVNQFIAGLNPEGQRSVLNGCQTAVADSVGYAPPVISFCENALSGGGAGASTQVLGFVPEPAPMTVPLPDAAPMAVPQSSSSGAY